ncbi:MAG: D-alanyl-D-alanine carboxypeptidase family protein [Ruminococcus sp.]|nr:D-alanyl-D-alanine carboxypeptidase family protein [Ruminococcus sp.]
MKFKRIAAVFTAFSVLFGLSACGKNAAVPRDEQEQQVTVPSEAQETTEAPTLDSAVTTAQEVTDTPAVTTTVVHGADDVESIYLTFYEASLSVGQSTMPFVTMLPDSAPNKSEKWTSSDSSVARVDELGNITAVGEGTCTITVTSVSTPDVKADVAVTVAPQPGLTYMEGVLIANKTYGLPSDYNPGGLTPETSAAFDRLVQGAANDGINIYLSSGFRSYDYQNEIYNNYIAAYGKAATDTFSARPGHSEHQTGMAIDVNIIDDSFIGTPEAIWIEEHCEEYGFILRYPQGKADITGYKYEPWHIRYVGEDFVKKFREAADKAGDPKYTLEEYFGIDSVYQD